MRFSIRGFQGPLAGTTRDRLLQRGHHLVESGADCLIYFPGEIAELATLVADGAFRRIVLRSHAYAYGSSPKNPGMMTEERVSLLPADSPAQRWLQAEATVARHSHWVSIRLATVLSADRGDALFRKLAATYATVPAGHDPNVQFLSLEDAAAVLVAAAESDCTGIFNAAGDGVIPLKKALRAAGTTRIPLPKPLVRLADSEADPDQLEYNWTVSCARAAQELVFRPRLSTVQALAGFLHTKPGSNIGALAAQYDEWGMDPDYIQAWGWWFAFLRKVYWRVDFEGMENIPPIGRALYVASHRGFMPLDGVIHLSLIHAHRQRTVRFLIIPSLLRIPFLCNFLTKVGGVVASQQNAARLFEGENLVGMFPEGIRGAFTPYKSAYKLRDFSKSGFARMAIVNQAPVIPVAVVGHAEIFPIIARINSSLVTRTLGWPYLPIAPMFPLAPVPIPSKWHVRILEPVPLQGLQPADADNAQLVQDFSRYIQNIVQKNIDQMVSRRKHIFWGHLLDGTAPPRPHFGTRERAMEA
ncbi:MAG TPA: 1-acyl-sn-glycerol-3-phosphate acyltransferase [Bryobacteraceae bacterium]|nr:1-acyl-sn-glycerol-3-phosphate acyltransferase [Bryobacteraceae bacterium]